MISKDYIVYRFTERITSDFSSAVSSLLVDANTLNWNIQLVQRAGLRLEMLSEILSPSDMAGKLTSKAAHDLGLSPGICVARGFLDSAAELIGVGALNESIGVIRLGSAGGVMVINRNGRYRKNCLAYPHPVKPFWYYQAGTNACTTSLLWVRNLFSSSSKKLSYARIDSLSQRVSPGCDGLLFHPYLLGERVPHWNPNLRGSFTGLTLDHGKAHFFRAVQEGVAFSLRDCLAEVDWKGIAEARICGGGAKSRYWPKIIADVLGLPIVKMQYNDASTYGAALLAISAVSGKGLSEIVSVTVRQKRRIEPDIETHNAYHAYYERYRKASEALVNLYNRSPVE